jgi:hypothetical protein
MVDEHIRAKKAAEAEGADQITKNHAVIVKAITDLGHMDEDGTLEAALTRFKDAAVEAMSYLPDTGNTNWDAVFAIDTLRAVWWRNTGNQAPVKALNPASEFAEFLREGFRYLEVAGNTVAAFRRWVAWQSATDQP